MRKQSLMLIGVALLLPVGLTAQRGPMGPRRGEMGQRAGAGAGPRDPGPQVARAGSVGMAFAPRHLLRRRDVLDLSDEQVAQLETLAQGQRTAMDEALEAGREHAEALREAWRDPATDPDALEGHLRALLEAREQAAVAGLGASARARAVLSEAQRGRVEGWTDARFMRRGSGPPFRRQGPRPARRRMN